MEDSRILYDAFNKYYDKGMEALDNKNYEVARRNILSAAETLYRLAKNSAGNLKAKRIQRADDLVQFADKIEAKSKEEAVASSKTGEKGNENKPAVVVKKNNNVSLEDSIAELMQMEGLQGVKQQVSDLIDDVKVSQMRRNKGLPTPEISYHMVFTGNPGTGKTTVARIIGQIFHALGILSSGHLVEVDRGDLVSGYVGQTALKTKDVINEAMGGILFIDEAYSLKKDGNDFGQESIDTLNKAMEDSRGDLVVIVAGYEHEMEKFINSNPGLRSRFRKFIRFTDYTGKELYNILKGIFEKNKYAPTLEADSRLYQYLNDRSLNKFTGNARDVRNLFENILELQKRRIARIANPTKDELMTITVEDLPFTIDDSPNIPSDIEESEDFSDTDSKPTNDIRVKDLLTKKPTEQSKKEETPEDNYLNGTNAGAKNSEFRFEWDSLPVISFDDIAGLEYVKDVVRTKVLLPLEHPDAFEGYVKKNGGGLFLYGPPGTGKTMIAAAIANEIGAKFCSVKPSDLLHQGAGNTEKAVRALFAQARQFPCAVIYFDEMDSIAQKNTKSSYSRQLRSELLAQLQGIEAYGKDSGNLLFLIAATNKPWEVDSAFVRPGRFGTKVYVGLPDDEARGYMVRSRFDKIRDAGIVKIMDDVDIDDIIQRTNGFNGSDITNLLDRIDEISAIRGVKTGVKYIALEDVNKAFEEIHSSVQSDDIEKLMQWKENND